MKKIGLLGLLPLVLAFHLAAADRTFVVVTNNAVINHWPGADGFVGTADDVVSADFSRYARSTPNTYGTYSLIVTSLGFSSQPDPFLPTGNDTATFVLGSVTIDPGETPGAQVPALKGLEFSGTDLFPGHGPYTVRVTNRRSGSPTRQGNVITFSARFDFEGQFEAGPAMATNALADGKVVLVEAGEFGAPDLSDAPADLAAYVNSVALPLARAVGASAMLCGKMKLITSASVPGSAGSFPALNTDAVVLAMEFAPLPLLITGIEVTPPGVKIQWAALPGKVYSVEATSSLSSPFLPLASNLSSTEYVDPAAGLPGSRYYRVRAD